MTACGAKPDSEPDKRETMIEEAVNLPDAEIKIPAALMGDELSDIPIDNANDALITDTEETSLDSDNALSSDTAPNSDATSGVDGASGSDIAEKSGKPSHGTLDADNNVTYQLDGDTRVEILNELAAEIRAGIDTVLADKEYYPNISDITVNSDCTEFTIYLTADKPNLYESSLMMSFYTVGDRYQIYNGVPSEEAATTVIYINAESGAELARTVSSQTQ